MHKKLSYVQAMDIIRKNDISSASDYLVFRNSCSSNKQKLPSQPMVYYSDNWNGWDEFTGVAYKSNDVDIDIKSLQKLVAGLNIKTQSELKNAIKNKQIDAPVSINKIKGFKNWNNIFHQKKYLPFNELLTITRSLGLKTQMDWREWCKKGMRPANIPFNLRKFYYDSYLNECPDKKMSFWSYVLKR